MENETRRRESNRVSQQRSREAKAALLRNLQEENELLRAEFTSTTYSSPYGALSLFSPEILMTGRSSTSGPYAPSTPSAVTTTDLSSSHQAFLATIASICDPYLNTIQAVCRKFCESRGRLSPGPGLHPPRPVNRPLNLHHDYPYSSGQDTGSRPPRGRMSTAETSNASIRSAETPSVSRRARSTSNPGSRPFHEIELDVNETWSLILNTVDISRTDIEALAVSVAPKIRCYGFGPVVRKRDLEAACVGFPLLPATSSVA